MQTNDVSSTHMNKHSQLVTDSYVKIVVVVAVNSAQYYAKTTSL